MAIAKGASRAPGQQNIWWIILGLTLILGACGQESTGASTEATTEGADTTATDTAADEGPAEGRVSENMRDVEVTDAAVAAGLAQFTACAACHGDEAVGRIGQGPALNSASFLASASDDFLRRTITHGRSGTTMPPWASLGEEGVNNLIAYLRSLNDAEPVELNEAPIASAATAEEGATLFNDICSACHGRTGAGYMETSNGTGIGRRAFLTEVSDGYLRYIIRNGKSETGMRGFSQESATAVANLSDDQIDSVITHLRQSAW